MGLDERDILVLDGARSVGQSSGLTLLGGVHAEADLLRRLGLRDKREGESRPRIRVTAA
jgi:hypothetical protein